MIVRDLIKILERYTDLKVELGSRAAIYPGDIFRAHKAQEFPYEECNSRRCALKHFVIIED